MEKEKIGQYEERLKKERERLLGEIKENETPEDFGSDIDAGDEEANEAEAFGNKLAIGGALRERIAEIDAALNRIREGTFGICIKCGKEISEDVLSAVPESQLCERCKKP